MTTTEQNADERHLADLAPCPYCAGPGQTDFIAGVSYIIECDWCDARTGCQDGPTEAVEAWNRRAVVAPAPAITLSDYDYAAIVKRYEDAGDVQNADVIRKQWEVARDAETRRDKLLTTIAAAYQVAGVHGAPEHILDVLADPEGATADQVDAMLPYQPDPAQALGNAGIPASTQLHRESAGDAGAASARKWLSCAPSADMGAVGALSAMLWLYRRLPHGYGRPPHIEVAIERLARNAGADVAGPLAERGPQHNETENQENGVTNDRT